MTTNEEILKQAQEVNTQAWALVRASGKLIAMLTTPDARIPQEVIECERLRNVEKLTYSQIDLKVFGKVTHGGLSFNLLKKWGLHVSAKGKQS